MRSFAVAILVNVLIDLAALTEEIDIACPSTEQRHNGRPVSAVLRRPVRISAIPYCQKRLWLQVSTVGSIVIDWQHLVTGNTRYHPPVVAQTVQFDV